MDINILRAQEKDAVSIAHIVRDLGWFAQVNSEPFDSTVKRIAQHLEMCNADDSHSVYVAELDGAVQGYAAVHWVPYLMHLGPEGYISELFIAEAARSHGVGSRLLDTIEQEARTRGCSRLSLLNLRTRDSYKRGFYSKHGWTEREDFANFIFPINT